VLELRGYHPRTNRLYEEVFGSSYVSRGHESTEVMLYPPSSAVAHMPGYVGHLSDADIVITKSSS
jgi:hypothetical protein